jgi:hypothetical protein
MKNHTIQIENNTIQMECIEYKLKNIQYKWKRLHIATFDTPYKQSKYFEDKLLNYLILF